jgi:hypothetical protein
MKEEKAGQTRRFLCPFRVYRAARLICDHESHFEKMRRENAEKPFAKRFERFGRARRPPGRDPLSNRKKTAK